MKSKVLFLLCLLLAVAVAAQAQKPLTNDDVVQMSKASFDEDTIVKAIQANEPTFDTSVDGLNRTNVAQIQPIGGAYA